jgi:hypothetical protein
VLNKPEILDVISLASAGTHHKSVLRFQKIGHHENIINAKAPNRRGQAPVFLKALR